jgi:small subunit ribosomal protein S6
MKTYELSYIVSPEVTSEEAEAKAKELELAVTSREGTVLRQSNPVAKTLSHPVAGRASGFFGVIEFQLEPEKVVELESIISKDGKINRHMVIIKKAAEFKKERRTRGIVKEKPAPTFTIEQKPEARSSKNKDIKEIKEKVELKDIEQSLDELLG